MSPCEAAKATARMLIEEAIGVRGSTDNVSVMVVLFHSFGFSGRDGVTPSPPTWYAAAAAKFAWLAEGVSRNVFVPRGKPRCPGETVARGALAAHALRDARSFAGNISIGQFDSGFG
ncbi:protein phosphatase 2C domain protein [Toxoplasma gondii TgCatPRC2]|nr:protein phosphatase 2C domain protein [Toxoplasma gondii TgCatPRC2]